MKMRIRNIHVKPATIGHTQPLLNRLRHQTAFTKPLPKQLPNSYGSNFHASSALEERLAAIEAERAQAAGRACVNMLPPK